MRAQVVRHVGPLRLVCGHRVEALLRDARVEARGDVRRTFHAEHAVEHAVKSVDGVDGNARRRRQRRQREIRAVHERVDVEQQQFAFAFGHTRLTVQGL
jgi:predicted metalloprotease